MKYKLLWLGVLSFLIPTASAFSFGTITPEDANKIVANDANAFILDIRTIAEWKWVGHPGENLSGDGAALNGKVINISYKIEKKGQMIVNKDFLKDVDDVFYENPDVLLITMCRSGPRGVDAAKILEENGYKVFNMESGFQGPPDDNGYRIVSGWVFDGLPYTNAGQGYLK